MTRRSSRGGGRARAHKPAMRVVVRTASSDPNAALRAALARESDRILHSRAINKALEKRVRFEVEHETDAPIDRMRPAFALDLYAGWDDSRARARAKLDASLPTLLGALATVLAHSFRLNAFPTLKRAFWIHILESEMMLLDEEDFFQAKNWYWMIDDPRFPAFSLDAPNDSSTNTIFDAIARFFTTPPQHMVDAQLARQHSALFAPLTVNVGLKFPRSALKLDRLQSLARTLDSVFASPTRQFGIDVLDLSQHRFDPEQLAVVASMLTKNHTVYKIPDVRLRNVTDVQLATRPARLAPVLDALLDVIAAACNTSLVHPPGLRAAAVSPLKKLQLDLNHQTARHVAALCSALRYSSSLEVLAIGGGLTKLDAREQELCWRWLAFGVFYPRSKRLAAGNAFRTLDLAHVRLRAGDLPAFLSALADPVRGLVHHDTVESAATKAADAELLCTIQTGAQFYATAHAVKSDLLHVLASECELEALVQEDGWTCVVLPGIGLGWVESAQVVRVEREAVDASAHSDSSAIALSLRHIELPDTPAALAAFHAFIEGVGPQLRALNLNGGLVRGVDCNATVPVVLRHCVRLQHLDMSNNSLRNSAISTLVRAFESGIGTQLLSLNLDYNDFTHCGVHKLARYLSSRPKSPALRELRLVSCTMQVRSFKSIYRALRANTTLQFINLTGPFYGYNGSAVPSDEDDESDIEGVEWEDIDEDDELGDDDMDDRDDYQAANTERARIEKRFQGKWVGAKLPLPHRLAFLSVLRRRTLPGAATASAQNLDSFMAASIIRFAGERVKRHILWEDLR